jgi:protein gp37
MSTGISWCDETWNPVVGCTKVSAGCKNCYAFALHDQRHRAKMEGKTEGARRLPTQYDVPFTTVQLKPERLEMPLRWRKPRKVFVNSVSDLFHERVPDEFIAEVFGVMAASPRHTFQILTKRPERMAAWFGWVADRWPDLFPFGMPSDEPMDANVVLQFLRPDLMARISTDEFAAPWPLPNVWCGVSVENTDVLWRVEWLRKTPAAIRFVSAEPLLGPLVRSQLQCPKRRVSDGQRCIRPMGHPAGCAVSWASSVTDFGQWPPELRLDGIDWLIVGGESGPGYRPMDHAWMRSLRDSCAAAGVAFFAKQDAGPRNEMPLPPDLRIRQFPEVVA